MSNGETLHQDARHRITRFRGVEGSKRAVICFEPGREIMNCFAPANCPGFATRLGIDALIVQTARRDWFVPDADDGLGRALARVTADYDEVTATGFSMGGYGALLYSKAARLRRVLVVSPQYSIDPAVADYDPQRVAKFSRIGLPMPPPQERGQTEVRGVLVFDPTIVPDRHHAAHILAAFPQLQGIALPHGGHPATSAINENGQIGRISEMLVNDRLNPGAIRRAHRNARRRSVQYRLHIALAAVARHPVRAQAALTVIAKDGLPELRLRAALALTSLDEEAGAAALLHLLDDVPDMPRNWVRRIEKTLQL